MTKTKIETRGRPTLAQDDRVHNGLFESQIKQLKVIAKKRRMYVSQLVREAVDFWLTYYYSSNERFKPTKEDDGSFEDLTNSNE